jgi:uncharacterized oligopeptide transporter (OPT) family protein
VSDEKPGSPESIPQKPGTPATLPPMDAPADADEHLRPAPLDTTAPQFTLRAVVTGMVLASLLSACNVYTGLTIGWGINMSITAALIGYGFWVAVAPLFRARRYTMLENNINQTACSAGASVSSAGLVAPIPALAMITGETLTWHWMALWVFSVCMVGITVAVALRRQMLVVDKLPFVSGIASAETLRELYAKGSEAMKRVLVLAGSAAIAAPIMLISHVPLSWIPVAWPARLYVDFMIGDFAARSLTVGLNGTLMMYAVGALVGPRAGVSMLIGGFIAWAVMAPRLIDSRQLRLTTHEPLPALPAGVELPPEPEGQAVFEPNKSDLLFKGVMGPDQRDALLAQSDAPRWREAIGKLYIQSQLDVTVPLAALPDDLTLTPDDPVRYDAGSDRLVAERGLDRRAFEALRERSTDAEYHAALYALFERFQYSTTRRLRHTVDLERLPRGFTIPRELLPQVRFNKDAGRLVAFGPLSSDALATLRARALKLAEEFPQRQPAVDRLLTQLDRLHELSHAHSHTEASFQIPAALSDLVTYDPQAQVFRARGILTPADRDALLAAEPDDAPGHADYVTTINSLVAGSQYHGPQPNFKDLVTWLLWPGVTLMVVASLVSFAFSWRSVLNAFTGRGNAAEGTRPADTGEVTRNWFVAALAVALILSVVLQISFFQIVWWAAVVGVLLTFLLAVVAARVAGETNITPVGAMGKVTQLAFGVMVNKTTVPTATAENLMGSNLMSANVTGGAASQCADMLHDLKCGHLIGAAPRLQALAQVCGVFAGAMAGSFWYLILVPNPREQLITDEWAAPAVAAWKAVAELFAVGFDAIPAGTPMAMLIAAIAAIVLTFAEKFAPPKVKPFMLSPASLGLAFVIQFYTSFTMFIGAMVALALGRFFKSWSTRFLVTICAGIIAGESLTGVGIALSRIDWTALIPWG